MKTISKTEPNRRVRFFALDNRGIPNVLLGEAHDEEIDSIIINLQAHRSGCIEVCIPRKHIEWLDR